MVIPDALSPGNQLFWRHIGTALLCGGIIGFERQYRGKVAGVRTSILICMGTSLFTTVGATLAPDRVDPTRVLGQVVTGIGFLGVEGLETLTVRRRDRRMSGDMEARATEAPPRWGRRSGDVTGLRPERETDG